MTKKLERKVAELEDWIAQFEAGNGDKLVFNNMNFLIGQLKGIGDRLQAVETSHRKVEEVLQQNGQLVQNFISDNELEEQWQTYLKEVQEDANAAKEGQEEEDK